MDQCGFMRRLFRGANQPADPRNPSDLDKRHTPVLDVPDGVRRGEAFAVTVEVGRALPHPNERGHFIEFIDLYAGEAFLARVSLTGVGVEPKASLTIRLSCPVDAIRALARCNLHGVWLGEAPIRIAD